METAGGRGGGGEGKCAAEGEGKWTWFEGNFEEYEADRVQRMGDEAPKPIKYATLA